MKKLNKFVKNGESKEVSLKETDQTDVKKSENQDLHLYDYNNSFNSRYENIDKYRIKISPKIQHRYKGEAIFNEITKELENIKSKHKDNDHNS